MTRVAETRPGIAPFMGFAAPEDYSGYSKPNDLLERFTRIFWTRSRNNRTSTEFQIRSTYSAAVKSDQDRIDAGSRNAGAEMDEQRKTN